MVFLNQILFRYYENLGICYILYYLDIHQKELKSIQPVLLNPGAPLLFVAVSMMIMIKNVIFSIAKAMVDNPDGEFWIIPLGTDCLKELFGILRTMVGTNSNSDILQLVSCLSGTREVSNTRGC